ncbi:MAG: Uncharacterised protein [Prochlorococcus marinus str. MIT 9215]|nr:MAG: Uncharacterised protein [Prochlorococcus marinus str. MIT 9215]
MDFYPWHFELNFAFAEAAMRNLEKIFQRWGGAADQHHMVCNCSFGYISIEESGEREGAKTAWFTEDNQPLNTEPCINFVVVTTGIGA